MAKKNPKAAAPQALKAELERKAGELIETVLKPKHIKPPPKNERFNYLIDLSTRWRGGVLLLREYLRVPRSQRDLSDF